MKFEKISENKIRCTLTREDLEQRHIRISELAYGSEKARALFREMMTEAFRICGFSNEGNIPLMIEATPSKENTLVLTITKVEDPEELDTRFSRFSATNVVPDEEEIRVEGADDVLAALKGMSGEQGETGDRGGSEAAREEAQPVGEKPAAGRPAGKGLPKKKAQPVLTRFYRFSSLERVIEAAAALGGFYRGQNTLYRLEGDGCYKLAVKQAPHTAEEYNKICNVLSEYGRAERYSPSAEAFLGEHEELVLAGTALQELGTLTEA